MELSYFDEVVDCLVSLIGHKNKADRLASLQSYLAPYIVTLSSSFLEIAKLINNFVRDKDICLF
jgi:hypothetical protein